jgi:hypothetical protein
MSGGSNAPKSPYCFQTKETPPKEKQINYWLLIPLQQSILVLISKTRLLQVMYD